MGGEDGEEEEDGELYVVRKVKDMRRSKATRSWEFLVRWKGYPPEDNTWEGPEAFSNPDMYKPLVDKLAKLRKATNATEIVALKALRKARWDLEDAVASVQKSMAAEPPESGRHRVTSSAGNDAPQPTRKQSVPTVAAALTATEVPEANKKTAPGTDAPQPLREQSRTAGQAAAPPVPSPDASQTSAWLQMLVRREKQRAPVPYAEVGSILDEQQKKAGGKLVPAYLVRWLGTGLDEDTWVVATRVQKAPRGLVAIKSFEQQRGHGQGALVPPAAEAADAGRAKRGSFTSQKRNRDTTAEANGTKAKKIKADTAALGTAVELRTGLQSSNMNSSQRVLVEEFEQWQLTGQIKPPTEKTCRKYFQRFQKFLHVEYEDYDVFANWDLCDKKRHDELMRTVKASARNKRDHGECSASLRKFILYLDARAQGWSTSAPVATPAGDTSEFYRGTQANSPSKPPVKSTNAGKQSATVQKQKELQRRAEEANKTKEELQRLLDQNRLREERQEAQKLQKQAKRKERSDGDQSQRPSSVPRHGRSAAKPPSATAQASATEMERLHERMTSLPNTAAPPKPGAIPKKRRPAAHSGDVVLEWQGHPVKCDMCKSEIPIDLANRGAMVDGRIFCSNCLPAESRRARDAWTKAHLPDTAQARPGSRPVPNTSDGRSAGDARNPPPRPIKSSQLCKYFNTSRGCFRGEKCQFRHERRERPEVAPHRPEPARAARYAPGQHPDQIPLGQQRQAAAEYQESSERTSADQASSGAGQSVAFSTYDYGRDEKTGQYTSKTEQAWSAITMSDAVRRIDAMAHFPRGALNHVISMKLSDALAKGYEDFKRLFDELLALKLEEQHKRELRNETTTCANRWVEQAYEVDEQMMMKLHLKDVSYDSKRIVTPARGGCCKRIDAPVFDLCSHVLSKVKIDVNAQQVLDLKHQQDPVKHPKRGRAICGAWPCPFCGKKAQCGCGWVDLEVDPTVMKILQQAPPSVDCVQVYCRGGDPAAPVAPTSALEGGSVPILLKNIRQDVVWRLSGDRQNSVTGSAASALPTGQETSADFGSAAGESDTDENEEVDLT